jgi:hypothetical protein
MMTIFEKNMDNMDEEEGFQRGFFDDYGKPADADLTWITPDMMEMIYYDRQSKDVDFWFSGGAIHAPYVTIHSNGNITASNLGKLEGYEGNFNVLRSYAYGNDKSTLMGQNIKLPKWMIYKAKQLSRMEGVTNGQS